MTYLLVLSAAYLAIGILHASRISPFTRHGFTEVCLGGIYLTTYLGLLVSGAGPH